MKIRHWLIALAGVTLLSIDGWGCSDGNTEEQNIRTVVECQCVAAPPDAGVPKEPK